MPGTKSPHIKTGMNSESIWTNSRADTPRIGQAQSHIEFSSRTESKWVCNVIAAEGLAASCI